MKWVFVLAWLFRVQSPLPKRSFPIWKRPFLFSRVRVGVHALTFCPVSASFRIRQQRRGAGPVVIFAIASKVCSCQLKLRAKPRVSLLRRGVFCVRFGCGSLPVLRTNAGLYGHLVSRLFFRVYAYFKHNL